MSIRNLLSSALLISGAAASSLVLKRAESDGLPPLCGTPDPSDDHKAFSSSMLEMERVMLSKQEDFTVDVYYHVVSATQAGVDNISDELIAEQMDIVSAAYAPHGISFNLLEITRNVNADWMGDGIPQMKAALRQGNYAALNVYTVDDIGSGYVGFCPFPEHVTEGDEIFTQDGCTILAGAMPGGDIPSYDQGGVLVHEIGHWMDIMHTFQDGCSPGDLVDDTPAMSSVPGRACDPNVVYDTCPNDPGTDPIHNWMNYTGDSCWEEFTAGQRARMHSAWETYRKPAV